MAQTLVTLAAEEFPIFRIVLVGAGGVGKTSLMVRLVGGDFASEYDPTLYDLYMHTFQIDGHTVRVNFDEDGAQEDHYCIEQRYRAADAFIFVYALNDTHSFDEIALLHDRVVRARRDSSNFPLVIVGNKSDLVDDRKVEQEKLDTLRDTFCYTIYESSAKEYVNVLEPLTTLARALLEREMNKTRVKSGNKMAKCAIQ
jgi:small GTP-binding protein